MNLQKIAEKISAVPNVSLLTNEPMCAHTSFKTGGAADVFVTAKNENAVISVLNIAEKNGVPLTVIGQGSNILVADKGIRGIVLKMGSDFADISVSDEKITAQSGISLAKTASVALANSLTGFEFASGIPGSLGGAVYMNAGAYGSEMKNVVTKTVFVDFKGNIHTINGNEHEFSYRHSFFSDKNEFIILSSEITLKKGDKASISEKMHELNQKRKEKQPLNFPSAGSAFKRPEGYFAAKLIEDAGLKGFKIGGAQISEKHAGFIVNTGGATSNDIKNLIHHTKNVVFKNFGVKLSPEIKLVGEWD